MHIIASIIAIIAITILLLISAIMRHRRRKAMESRDLDNALFRRIDEEWRE